MTSNLKLEESIWTHRSLNCNKKKLTSDSVVYSLDVSKLHIMTLLHCLLYHFLSDQDASDSGCESKN